MLTSLKRREISNRIGIREEWVSGAPVPERYRAEGAYGVCEEDSGLHRPVGAGAIERTASVKLLNLQ